MRIKRFLEKDARTAMSRARAELGPEAVILSNKSVGGKVELVAAIDIDEAALEHNDIFAEHQRELGAGSTPVDAATLADLQRELGNLRSMIEGKLAQMSWRSMAGVPSAKAAVHARLAGLGLSASLTGSLADILPAQGEMEDYWPVVLQMLVSRLNVPEEDRLLDSGGFVALMGSTGVGKTTTAAKLAARFVLRHGRENVALVTTDCYRIGGQEQLQIFARYLDIPCVVATDAKELRSALRKLASRHLVLIDTAGMSQRDEKLHGQYQMLEDTGLDIRTYLVLSATAQREALQETIQAFKGAELAGAIATKLDEAVSLGGLVDTLIENSLPLAYVSDGQQVPNDLAPAAARSIVARAVALAADGAEDAAVMRGHAQRSLRVNV
ncbi:MAG: flagellar biosynthesis protein FlhF [Halioglobus sp.]|nr:flagellar biosynthesis protein FlhF [Halioglobus sp.]